MGSLISTLEPDSTVFYGFWNLPPPTIPTLDPFFCLLSLVCKHVSSSHTSVPMHDPHDSQAAYPFLWLSSHLNLPVSYLLLSFTSETTSRQSCLLCGNYSMPGRQHCIRAFGHCKSSMLHTLWAPLPSWRISVLYPSWAPPPLMVHICA